MKHLHCVAEELCVNPIGCVPKTCKRGNKYRLIVALGHANSSIRCAYYKFEGIDIVCNSIQPDDSIVTTNLMDGFYHINVQDSFKTYVRFYQNNHCYVCNILSFGFNVSLYYFNRIIRELSYV